MSNTKSKKLRYVYVLIVLMIIALIVAIPLIKKTQSRDNDSITVATTKTDSVKVMSFSNPKSTTKSPVSIYNEQWQKDINDYLEQLKSSKYKMKSPLAVLNPYGTNTLSLYVYFNTKEAVQIQCNISAEGVNDYSYTLKNDGENNLINEHEYQLIGLVPDKTNTITLNAQDKDGNEVETVSFTVDNVKMQSDFTPVVESTTASEEYPLSDGLYFILGKDYETSMYNFMVDNDGVVRGEIPIDSYHTDNVHFVDGNMVYNYSKRDIAVVNRIGQVVDRYSTGVYTQHHDFIFDNNGDILALASKDGQGSIEDHIIKIDGKTKEITELASFKHLLPDYFVSTTLRVDKDKHDWIHFNSIDLIDEKEDTIVLSGRENSTIIALSNIYTEPTIEYMIADPSMWEGYEYKDLLLEKQGDFVSQAGQHTVTYQKEEGMADGTYYLHMFNNNFANLPTRPDFKWENYPGTGNFGKGEKSMFYKYLVDENKGTYTLVDQVDVDYSSIVSSTQYIEDNLVIGSGRAHKFYEHTKDGELIKTFDYKCEEGGFAYRVYKYNLNGYLFV